MDEAGRVSQGFVGVKFHSGYYQRASTLSSILEKIVQHKRTEIADAKQSVPLDRLRELACDADPPRDFVASLRSDLPQVGLIAEVKKASPSKGVIRQDFDPVAIATEYAAAGANCISVLTDNHFFQGHLDYLRQIRTAVDVPLLRKDFILDEYQVLEARAAGADGVLLIAECLTPDRLKQLHDQITQVGMTALVELYDAENLGAVLACNPTLVGVNNRDLNTFEVDLGHSIRIRKQVPADITFVSESGIFQHADVELLQANQVDAMLVGESLMRSDNISDAIGELRTGKA